MVARARSMTKRLGSTILALALLSGSGCVTAAPPIYRWGSYEALVYQMYAQPGKADPPTQVERLSRDIAEARANGERVPPGVHLHLGYMYWLQGNAASAQQEMELERQLFPESTAFVDHMLPKPRTP